MVSRFDRFQQTHPPVAYLVAVARKFLDDRGSSLAALLAYYGFLSLFPLLLLLFTSLGWLFGRDVALQHRVIHSALAQFPVVGPQLARPGGIASLKSTGAWGLVAGVAVLLWGASGVARAGQRAMADLWNVPYLERPRAVGQLAHGLGFLGVLVLDVVVSTALAGLVTSGGTTAPAALVAALAGLALNVPLFILGFRVLTPTSVRTSMLRSGAITAALGWSLLQYAGTALVAHELRHASELYGYFGSVLGLVFFLYLAALVTVLAAESDVVRSRHLYPRSLARGSMTAADGAFFTALAEQARRRSAQSIVVTYGDGDATSVGSQADG